MLFGMMLLEWMVQLSLLPATYKHISATGVNLKRCWAAAAEINEDARFHSVNSSNPAYFLFLFYFTLSFIVPLLSSRMKGFGTKMMFFLGV